MPKEKMILTAVQELSYQKLITEGELFIITSNKVSYLTHNIHKYPAKFIPHIPRWAIQRYLCGKNKLILDPFCGSGTTLVESLLHGHNSIGIDIDPLACLISKVKTTRIKPTKLNYIREEIISQLNDNNIKPSIPNLETLPHWFNDETINDLGKLRTIIDKYKTEKDIYSFLLITLSSIIRKVSNADNQSQKTYVSHTRKKIPSKVLPLFINNLDLYTKRLIELYSKKTSKNKVLVINNDVRDIQKIWKDNHLKKVDLVITSPPYIKAIDYIYNQMAEYFWIGDRFNLENQKKQNFYKRKYIGTKYISSQIYKKGIPKTKIPEINSLVDTICTKDVKHAYIVAKFFIDLEDNLSKIKKIMKKKSHYIMVIGDNNVNGQYVPSHRLLIKCAEHAGLTYVNHFGYKIRNRFMRFDRKGRGGIINEDWVLDFINE